MAGERSDQFFIDEEDLFSERPTDIPEDEIGQDGRNQWQRIMRMPGSSTEVFDPDKLKSNTMYVNDRKYVKIPNMPGRLGRRKSSDWAFPYIDLILERWYDPEKKQMRNKRVTIGKDFSRYYRGMMEPNDRYYDFFDWEGKWIYQAPEEESTYEEEPEENHAAAEPSPEEGITPASPEEQAVEDELDQELKEDPIPEEENEPELSMPSEQEPEPESGLPSEQVPEPEPNSTSEQESELEPGTSPEQNPEQESRAPLDQDAEQIPQEESDQELSSEKASNPKMKKDTEQHGSSPESKETETKELIPTKRALNAAQEDQRMRAMANNEQMRQDRFDLILSLFEAYFEFVEGVVSKKPNEPMGP